MEGDNVEDVLEAIYRFRNGKEGVLRLAIAIKGRIVFGNYEYGQALARGDLVDGVLDLHECCVACGDHDDGHELVCKNIIRQSLRGRRGRGRREKGEGERERRGRREKREKGGEKRHTNESQRTMLEFTSEDALSVHV